MLYSVPNNAVSALTQLLGHIVPIINDEVLIEHLKDLAPLEVRHDNDRNSGFSIAGFEACLYCYCVRVGWAAALGGGACRSFRVEDGEGLTRVRSAGVVVAVYKRARRRCVYMYTGDGGLF